MTSIEEYLREIQRKQQLYGCPWYWRCCPDRNAHRQEFYYRKIDGVGRFYCAICERMHASVA